MLGRLTQFWVKYGQTQMLNRLNLTQQLSVHILPKIGLKQPSIF